MSADETLEAGERRRAQRIDLPDPLPLTEEFSGDTLAWVANLSASGMMVISERSLQDAQIVQARFTPPPPFPSRELKVGVEVLWTHSPMPSARQWAGLQIVDIAASDQEFLSNLIDRLSNPEQ